MARRRRRAFWGRVRRWLFGVPALSALFACGAETISATPPPARPGEVEAEAGVPAPKIHAPPEPLEIERLDQRFGAPTDVSDLALDEGGGLWLASRRGLFVRPAGAHFFEAVTTAQGLEAGRVHAVGGLGPGLAVVGYRDAPMSLVSIGPRGVAAERIGHATSVYAIRTRGEGALRRAYVAADHGLLVVGPDGRLTARLTLPAPTSPLLSLAATHEGLWLGDSHRVAFVPIEEERLAPDQLRRQDLFERNDDIVAVAPCADGTVWVSGLGHGIARLDAAGRLLTRHTREEVLPQDHVLSLVCDLDGSLWIGTSWGGLARRFADGRFVYHTAAAGLPGDSIRRLLLERTETSRRIYLATDGGAASYDGP